MEYGLICFLFSYFILLYVLTRCYKCFLCLNMRLKSDFEDEFTSISPENSVMGDLGGSQQEDVAKREYSNCIVEANIRYRS